MQIINSGIYKITNTINGKLYIGSTTNLKQRKYAHFYNLNNSRCIKLVNAMKKYGIDNFVFEVIEYINLQECSANESKLTLIEREQYYLDLYQSYITGYNIIKHAGCSTYGHKFSEVQKLVYKKCKKGENNPMWNRKKTIDQIEKTASKLRGLKRTHEQKLKFGKHRRKRISIFTIDGIFIKTFESLTSAAKETGGDITAISKCLHNKPNFNTCKGFVWKYASE